ncbi:MAG: hypothetical protein C5B59_14520 [Bacteroidetes bacterium]|nr:MAG: hypothetical protein C5B59_14520 [Bacteroidota bacterium]
MRYFILLSIAFLAIFIFSCKKGNTPKSNNFTRTIQYVLYTNEDFSNDQLIIHFTLTMRSGGTVVWDSLLPPMEISQIPDSLHKIVINKTVPSDIKSDLLIGFLYEIETVGYSWHLDSCHANETFKKIEYPFE